MNGKLQNLAGFCSLCLVHSNSPLTGQIRSDVHCPVANYVNLQFIFLDVIGQGGLYLINQFHLYMCIYHLKQNKPGVAGRSLASTSHSVYKYKDSTYI